MFKLEPLLCWDETVKRRVKFKLMREMVLSSPSNEAFPSAENRARCFLWEKKSTYKCFSFPSKGHKEWQKSQRKPLKWNVFPQSIQMLSSSAWEHWQCWGWGEDRCWVTNSCCNWSHCKLPTGCYYSPTEVPICALQPAEGICACTFLHHQQNQPHQLKRAKWTELWLNPFSVGWGRRCRSTPSTARRFQAVRATTADVASRFTCMLHSIEWYMRNSFKK